jgi:hypothetical protein
LSHDAQSGGEDEAEAVLILAPEVCRAAVVGGLDCYVESYIYKYKIPI